MLRIGFTGTQHGMTKDQFDIVLQLILELEPTEVHHGDCIGADYNFHEICLHHAPSFGVKPDIVIHPPIDQSKRAFCRGYERAEHPKHYLDRNRDIIKWSNLLIATPNDIRERLRSGTWATIRYAREAEIPRIIILP